MSTAPPAPAPEGSVRSAMPEAPDPLVQDEPKRPRDFGIDVARLRRLRRIVFAILALPILILSLLIVRFVSMPLTQAWHDGAYDEKDYATAADRLGPVDTLNWFEPYLPHLTRGTDLLQQGQDAAAEKELRVALETWQEGRDLNQPAHAECKILNNLAISIERQADQIADPGERGDRLYEAEQLLAPCAGGGGGGDGEGQGAGNEDEGTTGGNGERIEDKRKEADEPSEDPPVDPSEDPSNDPKHEDPSGSEPPEEAPTQGDSTDDAKQDELKERNESANGGSGEESEGGDSQAPAKPW